MATNPEVRAARQERKQAKTDQKVAAIQAETAQYTGEADRLRGEEAEAFDEASQALESAFAMVRNSDGFVDTTYEGVRYQLATRSHVEELSETLEQAGKSLAKFARLQRRRDRAQDMAFRKAGEWTAKQLGELEERLDAQAEAHNSTHHRLTDVSGDMGSIWGFVRTFIHPLVIAANASDYTPNRYIIEYSRALEKYLNGDNAFSSPEVRDMVGVFALLLELFAHYNPNRGFSSILLPGDTEDTWTTATATAAPTTSVPAVV
jgi:hypothetical protein